MPKSALLILIKSLISNNESAHTLLAFLQDCNITYHYGSLGNQIMIAIEGGILAECSIDLTSFQLSGPKA